MAHNTVMATTTLRCLFHFSIFIMDLLGETSLSKEDMEGVHEVMSNVLHSDSPYFCPYTHPTRDLILNLRMEY